MSLPILRRFTSPATQSAPRPLPSPYLDGEWIPERCLIKEFTGQSNTLKKGNYSAPFFSPLGIHIVYLLDRRQGVYPSETTGNAALQKVADSGFTERKDSLLNKTRMELCQVSDGLLAAYWDKRHGGTKSGNISDKELQVFTVYSMRFSSAHSLVLTLLIQ